MKRSPLKNFWFWVSSVLILIVFIGTFFGNDSAYQYNNGSQTSEYISADKLVSIKEAEYNAGWEVGYRVGYSESLSDGHDFDGGYRAALDADNPDFIERVVEIIDLAEAHASVKTDMHPCEAVDYILEYRDGVDSFTYDGYISAIDTLLEFYCWLLINGYASDFY